MASAPRNSARAFGELLGYLGAVALGVDEPHRQRALNALKEDDRMVVRWGASVEYVAALSRRERDGSLTNNEVSRHLAHLRALSQVWYEVQPGQRVRDSAQLRQLVVPC